MVKSNVCDYGDAYILVKGIITVQNPLKILLKKI